MIYLCVECMFIFDSKGELVDVLFWKDLFIDEVCVDDRKIDLLVVIMVGGKGMCLKFFINVIFKFLILIGDKIIFEVILD